MIEIEFIATGIKRNQPKLSPLAQAVRLSIVGLGLAHGATQAATLEVTSNLDDNGAACTLRQAIVSLNDADLQGGCLIDSGSFGSNDSIFFSNNLLSNTILLTPKDQSGDGFDSQLKIIAGSDISIDASNIGGGITVDASSISSSVFEVEYASLNVDSMTITGGKPPSNSGGGLFVSSSTLILNNSIVTGNRLSNPLPNAGADVGGGLFATNSSVSLYNTTISDNYAVLAGGVFAYKTSISLINSSIVDNSRSGISGEDSDVEIVNSTFSSNSRGLEFFGFSNVSISESNISNNAESGLVVGRSTNVSLNKSTVSDNSDSGIVALSSSVVSVIDSTISGNSTAYEGGGFRLSDSTLGLSNSTVANNTAQSGAAIWFSGTSINLTNSIIADSYNTGADLLGFGYIYQAGGGAVTSDSASIVEGSDGIGGSRDADPGLLPFANNGGPTQTHALAPDSIARGTGDINTCTVTDQLGRIRDHGDGLCDVGAFESIVGGVSSARDTNVVLPSLYLLLGEDEGN